jgi:alginate O-acetyltransferase complex protein AlgJ
MNLSSLARRKTNCVLIAFFFTLLWLPTLDKCFNLDHSRPPGENRLPAPFPKMESLNLTNAQKYTVGLEAYFNDHFGFRKKLIRFFQNWKHGLFRDEGVYKVVTGRNHWLFSGEMQMVDHFLGTEKFTPEQLRSWRKLLEKRRDWLAERGIKYLFIVAPDKQSIYPEELPGWLINAAPTNRETKLDQFLNYMKANSTVPILDLRPPLICAKKIAPLYLQNDTHWNLLGGFIAAHELVKTLAQQSPGLTPLDLDDFQWTNTDVTVAGDLARMTGSEAVEKNYFKLEPKSGMPALRTYSDTNIFSNWDCRTKAIVTENPMASETLVVFHDSFGIAWWKILGYSFKQVVFVADRREFNPSIITKVKPFLVVNEFLERYFCTTDPEELLAHDPLQ